MGPGPEDEAEVPQLYAPDDGGHMAVPDADDVGDLVLGVAIWGSFGVWHLQDLLDVDDTEVRLQRQQLLVLAEIHPHSRLGHGGTRFQQPLLSVFVA